MFDPNRKKLFQILNCSKRLEKYDKKKKQQLIDRILQDLDEANVFFREDESIGDIVAYSSEANHLTREMIVKQKETELSVDPEYKNDIKQNKTSVGSCSNRKKTFHGITLFNRSPSHQAIADKNFNLLEEFARQKLHLNEVDNNGHTPLQMAMIKGYVEAEKIIRKHMA